MNKKTLKMSTILFAAMLGVSSISFAATGTDTSNAKDQWAKTHPRRHQVNTRLDNQSRRIHREVKEGDLTKSQAQALHKDDATIRHEERAMAKQNGGHITKTEQKDLNQQENGVSNLIGK